MPELHRPIYFKLNTNSFLKWRSRKTQHLFQVNNAGSAQYVNYLETTTEVFDTTFNLNIRAPFFLTKLCTTHLKKTKGCAVNVSSLAGQRSFPIAMVYGMTKAAMDQFTRTLAVDLVKDSVRVNSYIEKQKELQPLTGAVEPEEVAKVILFLASDQSSSITGELIYVDGGRHAIMPL
ncbi:uncharacterized oxidoreductase TM_0325-like [Saccostrea cucullata]|uniref:uncharacterized oxidoreductase TM_0325-like n=1 Tax=Saccostrea cuccullata TaxID=36930 RepID=UPI002ED57580